jgi:hypothetical protein
VDDDYGRSGADAPSGHSSKTETVEQGSATSVSVPNADSGSLTGYYGILNAHGEFWSHTVHRSEWDAKRAIREFWGVNEEQAAWSLAHFEIVQVRVRLELLNASAIEARSAESVFPVSARQGESATAESRDAQPGEGSS